jgi:hypothetical protein
MCGRSILYAYLIVLIDRLVVKEGPGYVVIANDESLQMRSAPARNRSLL